MTEFTKRKNSRNLIAISASIETRPDGEMVTRITALKISDVVRESGSFEDDKGKERKYGHLEGSRATEIQITADGHLKKGACAASNFPCELLSLDEPGTDTAGQRRGDKVWRDLPVESIKFGPPLVKVDTKI